MPPIPDTTDPEPAGASAHAARADAAGGLELLQAKLGYRFTSPELLQRALTHRSFSAVHNERLEFLGDAVLGLVVAHLLFSALGSHAEGDLSRMRANLVREENLHRVAVDLDLPPLLRLGAGELRSGGPNRPSILADAVEAIIGAVYLDGGHGAADRLVCHLLGEINVAQAQAVAAKDAKTALQEWLQGHRLDLPQYEVLHTLGAEHARTFEVACRVPGRSLQTLGRGRSHRKAEQMAAAAMLRELQGKQGS